MRTCAIREESRGQRVSGWSRARDRRRIGHVRPLFACSKAERASSRNTRRTGKIRATETHRLHVSREGRLGHGLLSLCGSAHGARLGPIARARQLARLLVRLAAARFLSNCVTTNPSMAMSIISSVCRTRYKRSSRSLQTSNFATRSRETGSPRPTDRAIPFGTPFGTLAAKKSRERRLPRLCA